MEKFSKVIAVVEKIVIIFVAIAALFPMYQWVAERDMRELQRTTEILGALEYCQEFEDNSSNGKMNLAEIDIYEEICSVIGVQLGSWYQDVFEK